MSGLADWVRHVVLVGLEGAVGLYYGEYDGKVVDDLDPLGKGRVRVDVPALGLVEPIENWASPMFMHSGQGYGDFWPPKIGDMVTVTFDFGRTTKPRYRGGIYPNGQVPPEFAPAAGQSPTSRGVKSPGGHWWRMKDGGSFTLASAQKSFLDLNEGVLLASNGGTAIFQLKDGKVVVIDGAGNVLSSDASGWTLQNGSAFLQLKGDTIQIAATNLVLTGSVSIGAPGAETPLVRFDKFLTMFLAHIHPTTYGPSGTPIDTATIQTCKTLSIMGK